MKRLTYRGPLVAEMTLDAERFDKFTDGKALVVDAPKPTERLRAVMPDDIEEAVAEIERAVATKKPAQIIPQIIPEVAQVAPSASVPSTVARAEPVEAVVAQEQPQPVEARQSKRQRGNHRVAQVATSSERRQLNLHMPPGLFDAVARAADREGCSGAEFARRALAERCDPPAKPHIDAAMMKSLREDGRPFAQFFADMVRLGIETARSFREAA